jgi:hypothetical protein
VSVVSAENRHDESEKLARDVEQKFSRVLGPEHPQTLEIELELVRILLRQKQYTEAELLATKVTTLSEKHSGTNNIFATSMQRVGEVHLAQGRIEEGRVMFEKAVNSAVLHLGEDHPWTKDLVSQCMTAVQNMGRMNAAALGSS